MTIWAGKTRLFTGSVLKKDMVDTPSIEKPIFRPQTLTRPEPKPYFLICEICG